LCTGATVISTCKAKPVGPCVLGATVTVHWSLDSVLLVPMMKQSAALDALAPLCAHCEHLCTVTLIIHTVGDDMWSILYRLVEFVYIFESLIFEMYFFVNLVFDLATFKKTKFYLNLFFWLHLGCKKPSL